MINHLKRKLFFRYMSVLFGVSMLIFFGGYKVYLEISRNVIIGSLRDYLQEEVFEFKSLTNSINKIPKRVAIVSSNNSLHYFSYWFKNGEMLHLEQPNGKVGDLLTEEMKKYNQKDGKFQEIKVLDDNVKWRFLALAQSWNDVNTGTTMKVVVLQNVSPYVFTSRRYISYGLSMVAILCLFSVLIASILASDAVQPMIEAYSRQKSFVSDVSHEMKTPLSVLMTYAEIMEKKVNMAETAVIKDEAANLSLLIDNLLSLSHLESGKAEINAEMFGVKYVVEEVVNRLNSVHVRQLPVKVKIEPDFAVKMEKNHLQRLVTILVDNAIKYTPNDKKVMVEVKRKDNRLCLRVKDDGVGISDADAPHIFERFYRADKSRSRKKGSFGLGLALADDIVRQYGGHISVKSELNKGSVFTVILPVCA